LMNLATQDMAAGRGLVVIDPKGDLVSDLLARVPSERMDDIVVLDPTDNTPVGLNPLAGQGRSPEARADGVLAVFRSLYGDAWGPRTNDILHACLLTLTRHEQASLVMVPLLLTNAGFRHSVAGRAARGDPLGVGSFWAWYEATSEAERAAAIAPLMNKLRSVLLRPGLRAVLGQTEPRFSVQEIFTKRRILLVNLGKGAVGSEAAALLGSLVIAQFWQTTLARAAVAPAKRHPVMVYVDEVQDYLRLPTDIGDALAQARGLGVGFTLAHQYLGQLPTSMRAAVLANARSRVCFQLPHDDAAVVAKGHSELTPDDLGALEVYDVYASLLAGGRVMPYAFGRTLPPSLPTTRGEGVREASRRRYGRPLSEVEAGWQVMARRSDEGNLGRRRREAS
ncbi:MAG: type IV secretory system conjugative DNA transfer family protein, partial [Vicinamibacterales bacterium]